MGEILKKRKGDKGEGEETEESIDLSAARDEIVQTFHYVPKLIVRFVLDHFLERRTEQGRELFALFLRFKTN